MALSTLAPFLFAAGGDHVEMGTVTANNVNVRARPIGTGEICCQLSKGESAEVLERRDTPAVGTTNAQEWVRITMPEKATVWLQSDLLDSQGNLKAKANGRAGPSLMWPVVCTLTKGEGVNVRTNTLDWTGIVPPSNASAWIAGKFLKTEVVDVPTPPTAKPDQPE